MNAKRPAAAAGLSWRKWEHQPWHDAPMSLRPIPFLVFCSVVGSLAALVVVAVR